MPSPEGTPLGELENQLWEHAVSSMETMPSPVSLFVERPVADMADLYHEIGRNHMLGYIASDELVRANHFLGLLLASDHSQEFLNSLPYESVENSQKGWITLQLPEDKYQDG